MLKCITEHCQYYLKCHICHIEGSVTVEKEQAQGQEFLGCNTS